MKLTESSLRNIVREEARRALREGFNTSNGMPIDVAGVLLNLTRTLSKLPNSSDISKQEYWTIYFLVHTAKTDRGLMEDVVQQLVKNDAVISTYLGISEKPAAGPTK